MKNNAGFSLIEALICLFIIAIAMLAIVKLQALTFRQAYESYLRGLAIGQMNSMVAIIHAGLTPSMADVADWQQRVKELLPQGIADINQTNNSYQLTLQWFSAQNALVKTQCQDANAHCLQLRVDSYQHV